MPTGYTAAIADGISFQQFAMGCARAFGALVTMRDEPADAEIPQQLEPSTHYQKWADEHRSELARLEAMTIEEVQKAAQDDHEKAIEYYRRTVRRGIELRSKYNSMLADVVKWEPPTSEHQGLKDFMLSQIHESIKFDCGYTPTRPEKVEATTWHNEKIANAKKMILRYEDEQRKENERTQGRNAWIDALRKSL